MSKQANHPRPEHPENKGQVDLLFQAVSSYSKCKEFKSLLAFCARFKHLSPYNAMLVQMQRPTATYVLTADEWKNKYNRVIKSDARPMIILVPFGPVDFVFDVYDTEPVEKMFPDDINALLDIIFRSEETTEKSDSSIFIRNLAIHGIAFEANLLGGDELGAQIETIRQKRNIKVQLTRKHNIRWDSYFLLSINQQQAKENLFASICYELGHLFCHHLSGYNWWNSRASELTRESMTFEATTTAWLVCERQGIANASFGYLEHYFNNHKYIPEVSLDFILQAANEIEKMLKPLNYQKGLLYKKDEKFRDAVRRQRERKKEEKEFIISNINYKQGELF